MHIHFYWCNATSRIQKSDLESGWLPTRTFCLLDISLIFSPLLVRSIVCGPEVPDYWKIRDLGAANYQGGGSDFFSILPREVAGVLQSETSLTGVAHLVCSVKALSGTVHFAQLLPSADIL